MSQSSQIPALLVQGIVINDDKEKAEAFNSTYLESSNLNDTGKETPPVPPVPHELLSEITVTQEDVNKALLNLKPDKAWTVLVLGYSRKQDRLLPQHCVDFLICLYS